MKTTINAKPADWTPAILERWESFEKPEGKITTANWFTARPYQDDYSRGSEHEGFVFTVVPGYNVFTTEWRVGKPAEAYTEPKEQRK